MSLTRLAKTGLFHKLDVDEVDIPIKREIKLHRAVLDKALVDSFSVVDRIRKGVERWLKMNNQDFLDACERAMLQPENVYETFNTMHKILVGDKGRFKKFGPRKPKVTE